jgi:hypothetical protein
VPVDVGHVENGPAAEPDNVGRGVESASPTTSTQTTSSDLKAKLADLKAKLAKAEDDDKMNYMLGYGFGTRADVILRHKIEIAEIEHAIDPSKPEPYVFEGRVIRLRPTDYRRWERAYPFINLREMLRELDEWAFKKKIGRNWFHAVSGALKNRNEAAKLEVAEGTAKANTKSVSHRVIL